MLITKEIFSYPRQCVFNQEKRKEKEEHEQIKAFVGRGLLSFFVFFFWFETEIRLRKASETSIT